MNSKQWARISDQSFIASEEKLNQDMFGNVYEGLFKIKESQYIIPCAIKVISKKMEQIEMIQNEIKICKMLMNYQKSLVGECNLVEIYEVVESEEMKDIQEVVESEEMKDQCFIVMEKCDETLETYRFLQRDGRISIIDTLDFAMQIANGLDILHSLKLIHRDLKADNILTSKKNGKVILKIGDFSLIGNLAEAKRQIKTDTYMSLEHVTYTLNPYCEEYVYTNQGNLWALGVIIHELVCGKKLFLYSTKSLQQNIDKLGGYYLRFKIKQQLMSQYCNRLSNEERNLKIYHTPWLNNVDCLAILINDLLQKDPSNQMSAAQVIQTCAKIRDSPDIYLVQYKNYQMQDKQANQQIKQLIEEAQTFLKTQNCNSLDDNNTFSDESFDQNDISSSDFTDRGSAVQVIESTGTLTNNNDPFFRVYQLINSIYTAQTQGETMIKEFTNYQIKNIQSPHRDRDVINLILKYSFSLENECFIIFSELYKHVIIKNDRRRYLKKYYKNQISVFMELYLNQNKFLETGDEKSNQVSSNGKKIRDKMEEINYFVRVNSVQIQNKKDYIDIKGKIEQQWAFTVLEENNDRLFLVNIEKMSRSLEQFIIQRNINIFFDYCKAMINFENVSLILQIAIGLNWLHSQSKNLVHGHLNCRNIYMAHEDSTEVESIKISFTSQIENGLLQPSEEVLNYQIAFKSPAVLSGKKITPEDDVWSLGIISHYICTKSNLFPINSSAKDCISAYKSNYFKKWKDDQNQSQGQSNYSSVLSRIKNEKVAKLIDGMLCINPNKRYKLDHIIAELRKIKYSFSNH